MTNLSDIYDIVLKLDLRGKAKDGFVRPTLKQLITSNRYIPEISNHSPIATSDNISVAQTKSIVIDLLANDLDIDGDLLTITNISPQLLGTVVNNGDGTITYTADMTTGLDTFDYTISDGVYSTTATVNITIIEGTICRPYSSQNYVYFRYNVSPNYYQFHWNGTVWDSYSSTKVVGDYRYSCGSIHQNGSGYRLYTICRTPV